MSKVWKLTIIFAVLSVVTLLPVNVRAALVVSVSPVSQTAPQATQASYTVSFSGGLLGATYEFSISGLPHGTTYSFSPTSVNAISGSSTLVISTSDIPGLYCPGSYAFTVSVTNQGDSADTGSASAGLKVALVGQPLFVNLSSDKTAYVEGDKITILITVNRPAEGKLTIVSPSGAPTTFSFQTITATTLTKTLTATQPYGTYTATVKADDYCNSYNSASITYAVGPSTYSVSIHLSGVPQQYSANLRVDGQIEGTVPGSDVQTLSFPIGTTHNVTVDQYLSGGTGVRYYCAQNNLIVSSPGSYTFSYQTQYQLTITTDPSGIAQVGNGGWFIAGASVQTGLAPQLVPGSTGVQYVFVNWVVDGGLQNGTQISITMNGPHNATANYKTQYLLTVTSANGLGSPQGGGYYDAGSTAQFSVTSPEGYLIQQVFVQWQGDYTGTSPQGLITMDSPKTVNATWMTSYTNVYVAGAAVIALLIIAVVLAMRRRRRAPPETKPIPSKSSESPGTTAGVIKCAKCGAENASGQKYCTDCGQSLTQ